MKYSLIRINKFFKYVQTLNLYETRYPYDLSSIFLRFKISLCKTFATLLLQVTQNIPPLNCVPKLLLPHLQLEIHA